MELTLDQALQKGVEAHKAGQVQEADRLYTAILKAQPKHPDANHNVGVLAVGVGKVEQALPFFKTALEANPTTAQFWLSYIDALIKLDKLADAKAVFDQAKEKGAKGEAFDELKQRLKGAQAEPLESSNTAPEEGQEQPNILDSLKLDQALRLAKKTAKEGSPEEAKRIYQDILVKFPKNKRAIDGMKGVSDGPVGKASKAQDPPKDQLQSLINLYTGGELQKTLDGVDQLLQQFPNSITLFNIQGASNTGLGKLEQAIEAFNKALAIKPDYAEAYNNIGVVLKKQGKLAEAIAAYNKALAIKPNYAEAYSNMGMALHAQGKLDEAIAAYSKALTINPNIAEAYNNTGNALKDQGKLDEAIEAYSKAIAIKPDYAEAWSNGAEALERWNKLEQLEIWLEKAFQAFEKVPSDIQFLKAKLQWRNKNKKEASKLISNIEFETITDIRKQDYLNLKAKYFETSKDFDEAYACFSKSNLLTKKSIDYLKYKPEIYFQDLRETLTKLKSIPLQTPKFHSRAEAGFTPVFLVGFPRSGTTLLDTILRSHSKIEVVEEQLAVNSAQIFLQQSGYHDLANQMIPLALAAEAKKVYEVEFNKHIEGVKSGSVCIDKLPLNLLQVPLIQQLYPQAKFILALRHPMDTILSCWMQNFKLNAAMANMVDLDRIVEFYCIAMETFKICTTEYNLSVHEIRYEDLLENLIGETSALLKFLDLGWEPQMENYRDTALKRGRINTPSYSQVVQPIYKDAKYRWLNYEKYLNKYLNQVDPWINEFGYSKN